MGTGLSCALSHPDLKFPNTDVVPVSYLKAEPNRGEGEPEFEANRGEAEIEPLRSVGLSEPIEAFPEEATALSESQQPNEEPVSLDASDLIDFERGVAGSTSERRSPAEPPRDSRERTESPRDPEEASPPLELPQPIVPTDSHEIGPGTSSSTEKAPGVAKPDETPPSSAFPTVTSEIDHWIGQALARNRKVMAARANVRAVAHRIPQAKSLTDPLFEAVIWPSSRNGPQYQLMGYGPLNLTVSQQFPWCGTLRLRGMAAQQELRQALLELAIAELDVISGVKQAAASLWLAGKADEILQASQKSAAEVMVATRIRYSSGKAAQSDTLRAENAVSEIEQELTETERLKTVARAELAEWLHCPLDEIAPMLAALPSTQAPEQLDRLAAIAVGTRPELQARLAAIKREQVNIELARKQFHPDLTLGFTYALMTTRNAQSPTADGRDNYGLVFGMNLPYNRAKRLAAIHEAQARASSETFRYEAERDATLREVQSLYAEATARSRVLARVRKDLLPRSRQAWEAAAAEYRAGQVDFTTVGAARRDVLAMELQAAKGEAAFAVALAALERAVGTQWMAVPTDPVSSHIHHARGSQSVQPPPVRAPSTSTSSSSSLELEPPPRAAEPHQHTEPTSSSR